MFYSKNMGNWVSLKRLVAVVYAQSSHMGERMQGGSLLEISSASLLVEQHGALIIRVP